MNIVHVFVLQVHIHPSRQEHTPHKLTLPDHLPADAPVKRKTMRLFAVLCINTSHYVSFVKYGPDPRSWIFFDSMADRYGKSSFALFFLMCCTSIDAVSGFNQSLTISFLSVGDDNNGYNIPVVRACPEVADFLSQSEEDLATADLSQCTDLVQRLLGDAYMCLYQNIESPPASSMSTDVSITTF